VAVSHQHLRESQALYFDYYSRTKKTSSALTKRVWAAAARGIGAPLARVRRSHVARAVRARRIIGRKFSESKKCL